MSNATRALLTYEVAFSSQFDWVKGGKLPGLWAGGKNGSVCSGGSESDGACFSARLMWRANGTGEGRQLDREFWIVNLISPLRSLRIPASSEQLVRQRY